MPLPIDFMQYAKEAINDEGVFTPDQIYALEKMIEWIKQAISQEMMIAYNNRI